MNDAKPQVRKLTSPDPDADSWIRVGDARIFVNDIVDQASTPHAEMTVGFARLDKGESLDISFPYDEVLVVTKGAYTVRTEDGSAITAIAGEVVYLPAGSANGSRAEEDTMIVYVAAPPSVYAEHVAASAEAR